MIISIKRALSFRYNINAFFTFRFRSLLFVDDAPAGVAMVVAFVAVVTGLTHKQRVGAKNVR